MNTTFHIDHTTPRQLAAIAMTVGAEHAWNATGDSSVSAYGHIITQRDALVSGMGNIERDEWFVLMGLLYDVKAIAQGIRQALRELEWAEKWADEQRAEAVQHGANW